MEGSIKPRIMEEEKPELPTNKESSSLPRLYMGISKLCKWVEFWYKFLKLVGTRNISELFVNFSLYDILLLEFRSII
ncbi:hypothetical protein C5167_037861 [Papaver somniferum]|uniref:Uncharacterized protein n=1 Tax=Papaver somniferum TaxID=3469 RepID=A0A4Y7IB92_PAPSO|nr:hypothetical protein C5167_037861 [Papaver somniferum]